MEDLKPHKLVAHLPRHADDSEKFKALAESIAVNGLLEPITLYQGAILDGDHRYRGCRAKGVKPRFVEFKGTEREALEFVVAKLLHRDMTKGQRVVVAESYMDELVPTRARGRPPEKKPRTDALFGKSSEYAALRFGVSRSQVETVRAIRLAGLGDPAASDLYKGIASGKYNVNQANVRFDRLQRRKEHHRRLRRAPATIENCRLIHGDCVEELAKLPDASVDLVWTDSQYNNGTRYDGDPFGDRLTPEDFLDGIRRCFAQCVRVLKPFGSFYSMIDGHYAARFEMLLRGLGLHRRATIFWWDSNPRYRETNFSDAVRHVHYFTKDPTRFTWNAELVRTLSVRNRIRDARGQADGRLPDNVWDDIRVPGNAKNRVPFEDAPPQIPVAIPERCILISSNPGDVVLDPYHGNGVTAVAAIANKRQYIGIERSKLYLAQSREWIAAELAKGRAA